MSEITHSGGPTDLQWTPSGVPGRRGAFENPGKGDEAEANTKQTRWGGDRGPEGRAERRRSGWPRRPPTAAGSPGHRQPSRTHSDRAACYGRRARDRETRSPFSWISRRSLCIGATWQSIPTSIPVSSAGSYPPDGSTRGRRTMRAWGSLDPFRVVLAASRNRPRSPVDRQRR